MKKVILVLLVVIVAFTVVAVSVTKDTDEYLRIHIRANSNQDIDQQIKYIVKDSIVRQLSPYLKNVKDKDEASSIINSCIPMLKQTADAELAKCGFNYTSNIVLRKENFPKRTYGDLSLDSGVYDALIVELGKAEGDNWWCVVFPPLCFVSTESEGAGYASLIYEKIQELINKNGGN